MPARTFAAGDMFSTMGLTYPLLLGLIPPVGAALIYAYRRRGRGRRVMVSSLLILKLLALRSVGRQKFVPPPRFWIELCVLIMLIIGAAGLHRLAQGNKVALILDNSISMARLVRQGSDSTLFDAAQTDAIDYLNQLSNSMVAVYTTSPALRLMGGGYVDPLAAASLIRNSQIAYAIDDLQGAIEQVRRESDLESIVIFTDKEQQHYSEHDPFESDRFYVFRNETALTNIHNVQNLALSDIRLKDDEDRRSAVLEVDIAAFTSIEVQAGLEIFSLEIRNDRILREMIAKREVAVAKEDRKTVRIEGLPAGVQALEARLVPQAGLTSWGGRDWLSTDNRAYITPPPPGSKKALLVGPLAPDKLKLNLIPWFSFDYLPPSEQATSDQYSLSIYHRTSPPESLSTNSLIVLPAWEDGEAAMVRNPQLTGWEPLHPLLGYLNLAALKLRQAQTLSQPAWAKSLIRTDAGPVAIAGEIDGRRSVVLGFEIFPYHGARAPLLSVLTLNALKWLEGGNPGVSYHSTYQRIVPWQDGSAVRYFESQSATLPTELLPYPGIVQLTEPNGEKTLLAVNYFNSQESDIRARRSVNTAPMAGVRRESTLKELYFYPWIAWAALLFIVSDLLLCIYTAWRRPKGTVS